MDCLRLRCCMGRDEMETCGHRGGRETIAWWFFAQTATQMRATSNRRATITTPCRRRFQHHPKTGPPRRATPFSTWNQRYRRTPLDPPRIAGDFGAARRPSVALGTNPPQPVPTSENTIYSVGQHMAILNLVSMRWKVVDNSAVSMLGSGLQGDAAWGQFFGLRDSRGRDGPPRNSGPLRRVRDAAPTAVFCFARHVALI
jgi:hypothetical protein